MNKNIERLVTEQGRMYNEAQALLERAGTDNPLSAEEEATLQSITEGMVANGERIEAARNLEALAVQGDKSAEVIRDLEGMSRTGEAPPVADPQPTLRSLQHGEKLTFDLGMVKRFYDQVNDGFSARDIVERAISTGFGTPRVGVDGGLLVPTDIMGTFYHVLLNNSGVRQTMPMTVTTNSGQPMEFPKGTDIGTTPRTATAIQNEATDIAEATPTFSVVITNPRKFAGLSNISREAYEDMAVDIEGFVARQLARKIAWDQDYSFTQGPGGSEPKGIAHSPPTGQRTSVHRTVPTYAQLTDLKFNIGNYALEKPCWLIRKSTLAAFWRLTGSDGHPVLFNPALYNGGQGGGGMGMTLLGDPVYISNHLQELGGSAAGRFPIVYGDFSQGYLIRDVGSVEITRSVEAEFASDQIVYRAIMRSDGQILNSQLFEYGITL